jgi:ubiquinone/menaquinone biosynthesis C-methylase UbiE
MPATSSTHYYDDEEFDYRDYWHGREYEHQAELIALERCWQHIGQINRIIDIGGGYGRLTPHYLPQAKFCILSEPAMKHLALAQRHFLGEPRLHYVANVGEHLSYQANSFDVALMIRVSHHYQDLQPPIAEISRILKPGGWVILEVSNKIHCLATLKHLRLGLSKFRQSLESIDRRKPHNRRDTVVPFTNHHPKQVSQILRQNQLMPHQYLSVSNFRHSIIKKLIPLSLLLSLEKLVQPIASAAWWGPSIIILARKAYKKA